MKNSEKIYLDTARNLLNKTLNFLQIQDNEAFVYGSRLLNNMDWTIGILDNDFQAGIPGIMLSLAAGAYIFEDSTYYNYALLLYNQLLNKIPDFSSIGFSGLGGILVASYLTSKFLKIDPKLFQKLSTGICPILQSRDYDFDFESGYSGLLLAISNIQRKAVLNEDIFKICIDKIFQNYKNNWWENKFFPSPVCGLAHGYSGLALALLNVPDALISKDIINFALNLLELEDNFFIEKHHSWPDLRPGSNDHLYEAWCRGSGGIALARMSIAKMGVKLNVKKIEIAINNSLNFIPQSDNLSLCHGAMGLSEVILQLKDNSEYLYLLDELVERININPISGIRGFETPSFMFGYAGMAYQILRFLKPNEIPNILLLEI